MERLCRLLMAAAFCCLLILACSGLVRGPEAENDAGVPPAPSPETAMTVLYTGAGGTVEAQRQAPRRHEVIVERLQTRASLADSTAPACDGNGRVLRGQSYIRTVYQAFPPESLPG